MKKKSNSSEEEFIYRNSPLNGSWRLKHQEIDRSPGSMQKLISLASNRLVTHRIRSSNEEVMIFLKWQHSSLAIAKRYSKKVAAWIGTYNKSCLTIWDKFFFIASASNEFIFYFSAPISNLKQEISWTEVGNKQKTE